MLKVVEEIMPEKKIETKTRHCDFCGKELDRRTNDEATLEWKSGNVFPDGDFRHGEIIDSCSDCAEEKVFPLLKVHFKIKPREYEGW